MWGELFNLENPLVGVDNTWMLWTICVSGAALAIYLEQKYDWASKLTGAILALIIAIVLSNLGVIPMDAPTWDIVWSYVVPLAIPLLLLQCNMRNVWREAGSLLIVFLIGSFGTATGALLAFGVFNKYIPELSGIAGMFTGTYIGGSVNFVALGSAFDISKTMISAATVADNLLMVVYFFVLIAIPSIGFFRKNYAHPYVDEVEKKAKEGGNSNNAAAFWGRKEISLKDIALSVATAFAIVTFSDIIAQFFAALIPAGGAVNEILRTLLGNKYLWITNLTMLAATLAPKFFGDIKGANEIGTFLIYLFFFVIGVPASIVLIVKNSPLLLVFAAMIVIINMLFSFVLGKIFKFKLEEIIIASNANIGGPTTAAAMAVSKGWTDLVGPAVLVGTLGYVLGTYFGLFVGSFLGL